MDTITTAEMVPAPLRQPLITLLLSLADDEFILGYWESEWTGIAPLLEEDVACSSIAQDEIGHARLLYQEAATLLNTSADQLAYGRQPEEYRNAQLVERNRGDWAFTIARQFLYDTADQIRLESLASSSYQPLAQDIAKIQREEIYHLLHVSTWLERLANLANPDATTHEAHTRLTQALDSLWPDAPGLFEPLTDEDQLLQAGILTTASGELQQAWLTSIAPTFARLQLPFPFTQTAQGYQPVFTARKGGRQGQHTQDFIDLWQQITMVYRLEPQGNW